MRVAAAALLLLLAAAAQATDGYDERVLALAGEIEARPANASLEARVAAAAERLGPPEAAPAALRARLREAGLTPLRVPGLYWRSHPDTGASLEVLERWLGGRVDVVATDEVGSVGANARRVSQHLRSGGPWLVVSASKGSADLRRALEVEPELGARVPLWIDLVGVLEGTPLVALAGDVPLAPPLPEATRRSLAPGRVPGPAPFPPATRAVHVAAFPRASDVSARARRAFELLRPLGPNDGYVLLDAYRRAPGRVLVVRGADHYLRVETLRTRFLALLQVLLDEPQPPRGELGGTKASDSPSSSTER